MDTLFGIYSFALFSNIVFLSLLISCFDFTIPFLHLNTLLHSQHFSHLFQKYCFYLVTYLCPSARICWHCDCNHLVRLKSGLYHCHLSLLLLFWTLFTNILRSDRQINLSHSSQPDRRHQFLYLRRVCLSPEHDYSRHWLCFVSRFTRLIICI